jgi:hypothetical protein
MRGYVLAVVVGAMSASCATAVRDTHAGLGTRTAMVAAAAAPRTPRPDALEVDVYPRITYAQSDAWVRLRVEPDARSRSVDLEWFSAEGGGGAHMITLEGERAAIRHQFPIKRLAAGEYEITAVLTRNDGTRVRRTTTMRVVGREGLGLE